MGRDDLLLPKLWTFSEETVVEALVESMEARGKTFPGLRSHRWELNRTVDGEFVLAAAPRTEEE